MELIEFPKGCYVMLHVGAGPSWPQQAAGPELIVRDGERFQLTDDIWIERLDEATAKNIQQACEPPHYKINKEIWDRHLYAFVMRVPDLQQTRYEGLDILHSVVSLSRLVNPTSTGDRYCAQVMHFGLPDSAIYAIQYVGASSDITLGPGNRDWLSKQDGEILRRLILWASKDKMMHDRVHRAYWNHELAMRSYYIDVRWTFIVAGLEALINVGKGNNTHQFCVRVQKLANYFSIPATRDDLQAAYEMRSKLVHAQSFLYGLDGILPRAKHDPLYETLELILRSTVSRALLDEGFGLFFRDDDSFAANWKL
jgi:hypothetical protein